MPLKTLLLSHLGSQLGAARRRQLLFHRAVCHQPAESFGRAIVSVGRPSDCAVWFGAASGLTQRSEMGIIVLAVLLGAASASLVTLLVCYRRNWKHQGAYETREGSRAHLDGSDNSSNSTRLYQASQAGSDHSALVSNQETPPKSPTNNNHISNRNSYQKELFCYPKELLISDNNSTAIGVVTISPPPKMAEKVHTDEFFQVTV